MDENTIVLWNQDGVETTFKKIFSIEIEGERYIMLSPLQDEISLDSIDEKLKDSDHGELLVHLKEEECKALTEKCKILVGKFINSYTD